MNPEHIITIVVRMRNEVARVANQVAAELDKVTGNQAKATQATRESTKATRENKNAVDDTVAGYRKLRGELDDTRNASEKQLFQLKQYRKELDEHAKKQAAGSAVGEELNRMARDAERRIALEKKITDQVTAETQRRADEQSRIEESARRRSVEAAQDAVREGTKIEEERLADHERLEAKRMAADDQRRKNSLEAEQGLLAGIAEARQELAKDSSDNASFNRLLDSKKGTGVGNTKGENIRTANRMSELNDHLRVYDEIDKRDTMSADHSISENERVKKATLNSYNEIDDAIDRLAAGRDRLMRQAGSDGLSGDERMRQLGQYRSEFRRVGNQATRSDGIGSARSVSAAREVDSTGEAIDKLRTRIRAADRDTNLFQGTFAKLFRRSPEQIESINSRLDDFDHRIRRSQLGVAKFDNVLRGLVVAGVVIFLQQLVGVVVAVGGALIALASSAVQAGAALGGALVAGAAQALPALGLLAAAWGRVGAVFDVLKARQKENLKSSVDAGAAADRQRQAADQLRSAEEAVANAHDRVTEAQQALTKARADARREIEDLTAAEARAILQAKQADLSQRDAQRALRLSLSTGDVSQNESNQLNLESANQSLKDANQSAARAKTDGRAARAGGIEGNAGVIAAAKALKDANQSAGDAARQLAEARTGAAEDAGKLSAAAQNVQDLLANLSPSERKLYDVLARVQDRYKKVFTGSGGVLESITDAFTVGGNEILDLLDDPKIIAAATRLSQSIGGSLSKIFQDLGSENNRNYAEWLSDEAVGNMPTFVHFVESLGRLLRTISIAAAPAFKTFLEFLDRAAASADDSTSNNGGFTKLENFFTKGEEYAESILKLGYAVAQLFGAVIGVSADDGANAFDQMTAKVQDWTKYIHDNQQQVDEFFKSAIRAAGFVTKAFGQLLVVLLGMFNEDHVKTFSESFTNVLLPALEAVFKVMGGITQAFLTFFNLPGISTFATLALSVGLLTKLLTPLVRLFGIFFVRLGALAANKGLIAFGEVLALGASRGIITSFAILASLIALLAKNFDFLGDNLGKVLIAFTGISLILFKGGGLLGVLTKIGGALSGIGLGGVVARLGRIGAAFGKILAPVTALATKIPILSKLLGLGGAAAAGGVAARGVAARGAATVGARTIVPVGAETLGALAVARYGTTVARGLNGTEAVAGAAKFAGFLKTSLITSIGIAAAQGLYTGFKNKSVADGIRDFGSSLTFGLIKSVKNVSKDLQAELAKAITPETINTKTPEELLGSRPKNFRYITSVNGAAAPVATYDEGNPLLAKLQDRYGGKEADQLKGTISKLLSTYQGLKNSDTSIASKLGFDDFITQARAFRDKAPKELTGAMNLLIQAAKDGRKKLLDELNKPIIAAQDKADFLIDFGAKIQLPKIDAKELLDSFEKQLSSLPKSARKATRDSALNMVDELEKGGQITKKRAETLRDGITDRWKEIRDRSAKRAQQTKDRTARQMAAMVAIITDSMTDAVTATNTFLDALGVKKVKMPDGSTKKTLFGLTIASTPGDTTDDAGNAGGGFIGKPGQRGADTVRTVLGKGEAVLNAAHQRIVQPALAYAKSKGVAAYGSLQDMFKGSRSEHGTPMGKIGMATGGFVNNVGAHIDTAGERGIASALKKMGEALGITFAPAGPRSARRTPSENAAVGGSPTSNHLRGLAMDVAPEAIKTIANSVLHRFGLNRPMPGNWTDGSGNVHDERNHIELNGGSIASKVGSLVSGIGKVAQKAVAAVVKKLKTPDYGDGPLAGFTKALVAKVVKASNKKMEGANDSTAASSSDAPVGGGAAAPEQVKAWATKALKITKRFSPANLTALIGRIMFESGGNPKAINLYDSNAQAGHPSKGLGQTIDSTFQSYRLKSLPNNIYDPIANLVASIRYMIARYGHIMGNTGVGYAGGGEVNGQGTGTSDSVPARLSVGEHVWTAAEVAAAGGHRVMYAMRKILGGGKQSTGNAYKDGGGVTAAQSAFKAPDTLAFSLPGIDAQTSQILTYLKGLRSKSSNFLKNFRRAFSELFDETDGIMTRFTAAMEQLATDQASALTKATYKITKTGAVVKSLSDTAIAGQQVSDLGVALDALLGKKGQLNAALETTTTRLRNLRKGGITKSEKSTYDELKGYQKKLKDGIKGVNDSIATNLQSRYQAVEDMITAFADKANTAADNANAGLGIKQRIQTLTGTATPNANAQQQAGILQDQIKGITLARNIATNQGHKDTAATLQRQIDDLQVQISEALAAGIQGEVDQITKNAGRKETYVALRERFANALGRTGDIAGIINDRIQNASDEITSLTAQMNDARSKGFNDIADQIQDQIADLNTSITELAAQRLQNAVDLVNSTADKANAVQAIKGRFADLKEKAGNFEGAFSDRAAIIGSQAGIIGNQRNALYGLLNQANADGNQGQVDALTAQIADLDAQLAENTQAQHENTVGLRQARIDAITSRGGFLGGVYGGLGGVLDALGSLTGTTDSAGKAGLLTQAGATLQQTGSGLKDQLASSFGVDLRGLDPAALVKALSSLNFDAIETNMAPDDKAQFEALINSIIENTTAQVTNTDEIKKATNPTTQSFQSTGWQWFRNAIFDGNGGLLQHYTNPALGVTNTVSGFTSQQDPASYSGIAGGNTDTGGGTFTSNLYVTESVPDYDPEVVSNRIYQRYKARPKS